MSAPEAAMTLRVAPRRVLPSAPTESTPKPYAAPSTTAVKLPVNAEATPSALRAVNAARACVPRGRLRSALVRERAHAVRLPNDIRIGA